METVNKAAMIPSKKEYSGEKIKLWKEALQKTINEVEKMNATEVAQKLDQYKDVIPGKTNDNTFEMMALYQKALTFLGTKTKIDSRFGTETHTNLKTVQAEKLKFTGTDTDGLPGPKTTKALITELGKTQTSGAPAITVTPPATQKPAASVSAVVTPIVASSSANQRPATSAQVSSTASSIPARVNNPTSSIWVLDTKINFVEEQKKANEAITNAKKPSLILLSWNGNFYNGSSPNIIDYAIVRQPDGELYVFDKPNQDSRMVYRMTNHLVTGSIQIDVKWGISQAKWAAMKNVSYMPTPTIVAK